MKIRLAILEDDRSYLNRITTVFNTKYMDKLEIYSFTSEQGIYHTLAASRIDVLLASDAFEIDIQKVPPRCGFAYLVYSADIESVRGEPALCKFQKAELIYKQILNIFAEKTVAITGSNQEGGARVILFTGAAGGVGCTSVAVGCAMYFAGKGKRAVYLNLETIGNADSFFRGEGQGNFSDIIYAVKSRKANLSLKLESLVKQDTSGAFFFSAPNTALDMLELKPEEIRQIIAELRSSCGYDYVILDISMQFGREMSAFFQNCSSVVFISDGSVTANDKTARMLRAMEILEEQGDGRRMYDMGILYNRFSSRTSGKMKDTGIREIGGIKRFEECSPRQLGVKISEQDVFRGLE
ncbi:MAG: chromosome partitioning protein ParA [Lachnospiraceae bacterium]|nr:chromosome partitioning protein ParA [Lachnospiraceae bacterium]